MIDKALQVRGNVPGISPPVPMRAKYKGIFAALISGNGVGILMQLAPIVH
jgi:hypothetical protein